MEEYKNQEDHLSRKTWQCLSGTGPQQKHSVLEWQMTSVLWIHWHPHFDQSSKGPKRDIMAPAGRPTHHGVLKPDFAYRTWHFFWWFAGEFSGEMNILHHRDIMSNSCGVERLGFIWVSPVQKWDVYIGIPPVHVWETSNLGVTPFSDPFHRLSDLVQVHLPLCMSRGRTF